MESVAWIMKKERRCVDGIMWEKLEHVAFNQNTYGCQRPNWERKCDTRNPT